MDSKSFELLYHDAEQALLQDHLQEALSCIQGILSDCESPEMNREAESLRQDYGMMLTFMAQGGVDPQRAVVHRSLTNRAFALLDRGARLYRLRHIKDLYADIAARHHGTEAEPYEMLAARADLLREKRAETRSHSLTDEEESLLYATYDKLFEHVWTAPLFHPSDAEELESFIERQEPAGQALLISSVTLAVLQYFDPQKYRILLHFCKSETNEVRARALTAAVWAYMRFTTRFAQYPDLKDGLSLLSQDERLKEELALLQRQLLLSLEAAKAEKKLQNEIFPDLLKNRNYQRNKIGLEQMEEDLAKALRGEPNAEWEQMQGNRHLADNMKKIIAMGQEGIDINLGTFSGLKGFSFFQSLPHWFAPFNSARPEIRAVLPEGLAGHPIGMLMDAGNFCDSDKYSLCLMLSQIPASQREMMVAQIGAQMGGNEEHLKEAAKGSTDITSVYRNYLQDLYRFYKLHPRKAQFDDPFRHDLLFTRYPILEQMTKSPGYLREMASFLIRRECYQDAIGYIEEVLKKEPADAEMLEKMAFCHQQLDLPDKAIYYYQQADLLNPDNEWILKQMYICYSAMGRYEQELGCLKSLEAMNPGDARLISETGLCLMQLKRYEEAAQRFYELEYKGERVIPSWRAIAWCNFKMKRLEQADRYYKKILQQDKVTWEDWLNAGHTAWCRGNTAEAIGLYQHYVQAYCSKKKDEARPPLAPFDEDREELLAQGIDGLDISLMRDILQRPA